MRTTVTMTTLLALATAAPPRAHAARPTPTPTPAPLYHTVEELPPTGHAHSWIPADPAQDAVADDGTLVDNVVELTPCNTTRGAVWRSSSPMTTSTLRGTLLVDPNDDPGLPYSAWGISPGGTYIAGGRSRAWAEDCREYHDPIVWSGSEWSTVELLEPCASLDPAFVSSKVNAVNDNGLGVGFCDAGPWANLPVTWSAANGWTIAPLGLGETFTDASPHAVNSAGMVAGTAGCDACGNHAVVWRCDQDSACPLTPLPEGSFTDAQALDVNDHGDVFGDGYSTSGGRQAVAWRFDGSVWTLDTLAGAPSSARAGSGDSEGGPMVAVGELPAIRWAWNGTTWSGATALESLDDSSTALLDRARGMSNSGGAIHVPYARRCTKTKPTCSGGSSTKYLLFAF